MGVGGWVGECSVEVTCKETETDGGQRSPSEIFSGPGDREKYARVGERWWWWWWVGGCWGALFDFLPMMHSLSLSLPPSTSLFQSTPFFSKFHRRLSLFLRGDHALYQTFQHALFPMQFDSIMQELSNTRPVSYANPADCQAPAPLLIFLFA